MSSFLSRLFGRSNSEPKPSELLAQLENERIIFLDAETLAEQGMTEAYRSLLPELTKYVNRPAPLEELVDHELPSYKVRCGGEEYEIYGPETEDDSWGRATYFFFLIVNKQLSGANVRFYAMDGGNDLGGLFLAPDEARAIQAVLPRKTDWPYLPELSPPFYGQFH